MVHTAAIDVGGNMAVDYHTQSVLFCIDLNKFNHACVHLIMTWTRIKMVPLMHCIQ